MSARLLHWPLEETETVITKKNFELCWTFMDLCQTFDWIYQETSAGHFEILPDLYGVSGTFCIKNIYPFTGIVRILC